MAGISKALVFLTFKDIVSINEAVIQRSEGLFAPPENLLNQNSLLWVLEAVQSQTIFGADPYASLSDKASLIAWTIINDHVFNDGNKRTGMVSMAIFLELNGMSFAASDDEIVTMALKVANHREQGITREALAAWIAEHTTTT
ncbi:MAG: type II toxin-antitoxin system death-on-curing family toxin [Anaerolineales bacterium]|nr:MAG: type II toxin-antitoxin system death-on-curing family toxin [Anaerolineales bacterium]